MTESSGWVGYVPGGANEHLLPEQREAAGRPHREVSQRRGGHLARVVVDTYENGEAVPQIQFPKGHVDPTDGAAVPQIQFPKGHVDPTDGAALSGVVRGAAAALADWR